MEFGGGVIEGTVIRVGPTRAAGTGGAGRATLPVAFGEAHTAGAAARGRPRAMGIVAAFLARSVTALLAGWAVFLAAALQALEAAAVVLSGRAAAGVVVSTDGSDRRWALLVGATTVFGDARPSTGLGARRTPAAILVANAAAVPLATWALALALAADRAPDLLRAIGSLAALLLRDATLLALLLVAHAPAASAPATPAVAAFLGASGALFADSDAGRTGVVAEQPGHDAGGHTQRAAP